MLYHINVVLVAAAVIEWKYEENTQHSYCYLTRCLRRSKLCVPLPPLSLSALKSKYSLSGDEKKVEYEMCCAEATQSQSQWKHARKKNRKLLSAFADFFRQRTIPNIPCHAKPTAVLYYAVILSCHVAIRKVDWVGLRKSLFAFACLACLLLPKHFRASPPSLYQHHIINWLRAREREREKKWTCEQNVHTHIRTLQLLTAFIKRGKEKERMSEKREREEEELCVTLLWHSITFKLIGSVRKLNWEFSSSCTVNTRKAILVVECCTYCIHTIFNNVHSYYRRYCFSICIFICETIYYNVIVNVCLPCLFLLVLWKNNFGIESLMSTGSYLLTHTTLIVLVFS